MGSTLIALAVSVLITLAGAYMYSSHMEKSKGKNPKTDINSAEFQAAIDAANKKI